MPRDKENLRRLRREWYHKNRDRERKKQLARNAERTKLVREYIIKLKESTPCKDCGNKYPHYVMDFDHLDSTTKSFDVGSGVTSRTLGRMQREIEKCEIVCANCHRERTYGGRSIGRTLLSKSED